MAGWAFVGVGIGIKGIPTIRAFPTGHFFTSLESLNLSQSTSGGLTPNSFVVSLLKMVTYSLYAALFHRPAPFEHLDVLNIDVKSRFLRGPLNVRRLFLMGLVY